MYLYNPVTLYLYYSKGFTYDANGNLTSTDDGWTVSYNLLNLPATATRGAGTDDEQTVEWSYLADGTKIGAWSWVPIDDAVEDEVAEESLEPEFVPRSGGQGEPAADSLMMRSGYLYAGAFRLRWDDASVPTLESAASVGGRLVQNGNGIQQRYFITDQLGSTRVVNALLLWAVKQKNRQGVSLAG